MLTTIMQGQSNDVMREAMPIIFPDARTVLDMTYGNGSFWKWEHPYDLTTMDIRPVASVVADFSDLPFGDGSLDVAVFDPPFLTDVSAKNSIMGKQYTSYPSIDALKRDVCAGLREAWRVSKLGIVYKCQDYIHASKVVWMSDWARETLDAPPYDVVYLQQRRKVTSPSWKNQLSVRRNHSVFWFWRKDGAVHKLRSSAVIGSGNHC